VRIFRVLSECDASHVAPFKQFSGGITMPDGALQPSVHA